MRMGIGTVLCVVALVLYSGAAHAFECPDFIYAFGDSLSDTGNAQAEVPDFEAQSVYPYGKSYRFPDRPGERTRFSDGRLVLDFIAQAFGLPFLEPYSRRLPDADYSHGVNFAISAATARSGVPPFPDWNFEHQVSNYKSFKAAFTGAVNVSTALHLILAIGGNDLRLAFRDGVTPAQAMALLTDKVVHAYTQSLEKIYNEGAKSFYVFNQHPAGCTPDFLTTFAGMSPALLTDKVVHAYTQSLEKIYNEGAKSFYVFNQHPAGCTPDFLTTFAGMSPLDEYGCLSDYNAAYQYLNGKLKAVVEKYRKLWPDTTILYFDWYNATLEVLRNPDTYGIRSNGNRACCGGGGPYNFDDDVMCGPLATVVCEDPEHTIFWDQGHFTEGFNRVIATFALTGKFVDGPFEIVNMKSTCNLDFSSFPIQIPNPNSAYS